jgi:hypothetical protein
MMLLALALSLQDVHVDETRGFSMPIPKGWSVSAAGDDVATLRMSCGEATFVLRLQVPLRALNGGAPSVADLASQLRAINAKKWKDYEQTEREATPARAVIEASWTDGEKKMRGLQWLISEPSRLCVLTWVSPAESFASQLASMDAASGGFKLKK